MHKNKTKTSLIFIICAALCLIVSFAALFFYEEKTAISVFSDDIKDTFIAKLLVQDSKTFSAIENAQIVIPEIRQKAVSDKYGNTEIKISKERDFANSSDYAEVDILVFAEGYPPHAYLNACIYKKDDVLCLFLRSSDENVVVPMKPDESDIRDFIDKNRP